jgi:hypothetical protein
MTKYFLENIGSWWLEKKKESCKRCNSAAFASAVSRLLKKNLWSLNLGVKVEITQASI